MHLTSKQILAFFLSFWIVLALRIIVRDPMQIGVEEGVEFSQALRVSNSPESLMAEWSDHPWFYSYLFGKIAGANLTCMRLSTLMIFVVTCWYMGRALFHYGGTAASMVGVLSLVTWPSIPKLSMSAMGDLPSVCLIILSVLLPATHSRLGRCWLYLLSGALAGIAISIKLHAAVLLPFALILLFSLPKRNQDINSLWRPMRAIFLPWFVAFALGFFLCNLVGGISWAKNFLTQLSNPQTSVTEAYTLGLRDFLPAAGTCFFAIAAIALSLRSTSKSLLMMMGGMVCIIVAIHSVHRPFLEQYTTHFAFPISMLAGIGFSMCLPSDKLTVKMTAFRTLLGTAGCCLSLTTNVVSGSRQYFELQNYPRATENSMLTEISALQKKESFGFSDYPMLLSRAGLLALSGPAFPQLPYSTRKVTDESLFEAIKNNQPILIILNRARSLNSGWRDMLAKEYVRSYTQDEFILFVRKDLNPKQEHLSFQDIRAMGL